MFGEGEFMTPITPHSSVHRIFFGRGFDLLLPPSPMCATDPPDPPLANIKTFK